MGGSHLDATLTRRVRRVLIVFGVLVAVLMPGVRTRADSADQQGWWNKLRQSGVPAPAPPDAPDGGLYVAADPSGPSAIAALRFSGDLPGTLKLKVAPSNAPTGTSVSVFPATSAWTPVQNGNWEDAPTFNGAGSVTGKLDGTTMTWTLPASFPRRGGVVDLVLVETGATAAQTPFAKPGADAFTSTAPPTTAVATPDETPFIGFAPNDFPTAEPQLDTNAPATDTTDTTLFAAGSGTFAEPGATFGNGSLGGYQAIRWDAVNNVYWGASESRKDGCAIGY